MKEFLYALIVTISYISIGICLCVVRTMIVPFSGDAWEEIQIFLFLLVFYIAFLAKKIMNKLDNNQ